MSWMHLVFPDQINCVTIMQLVATGEDNEKGKHNLEPVCAAYESITSFCYVHSIGGSEEQNIC